MATHLISIAYYTRAVNKLGFLVIKLVLPDTADAAAVLRAYMDDMVATNRALPSLFLCLALNFFCVFLFVALYFLACSCCAAFQAAAR